MPHYQAPNQALWTGRAVDPDLPPQYWHQVVEFIDLESPGLALRGASVLLGYAVEEGVRRNQGRVGTAAGPDTARPHLGRLANHLRGKRLVDAGNITCHDGDLEAAQEALSQRVAQICRAGGTPILVGGGHDIAYAHFRGLQRAFQGEGRRFGVLNFDAHFDLRGAQAGPTSGTPFRQILEEFGHNTTYMVVGIQRAANPPELYEYAKQSGVQVIPNSFVLEDPKAAYQAMEAFAGSVDSLYITVDTDCFNAGAAPGVSAPNPVGLPVGFVLNCLHDLQETRQLAGADVAEFNPAFDRDGITARLVCRVVDALV